MKVYVGYDAREHKAYEVAVASLFHHASDRSMTVTPLVASRLHAQGLLRRPNDARGVRYDLHSNAPMSTEFAISRFLVPHLAQNGWALFVDCDVVFMDDMNQIKQFFDPSKAVLVVQHQHAGIEGVKMDGQPQLQYSRKNWSSVVLWNCDHPANQRLSLDDVNYRRGLDLHNFYWLNDNEIGALPPEWNWLVDVQDMPEHPAIAHFTLGGPFLPEWPGGRYDYIWHDANTRMHRARN